MKRKFLLGAIALISCICMYADYTQVLPLNYEDFFRADAIAVSGTALERDAYTGTTQGESGETLKANQWNRGGKDGDDGGENPAIAASTLAFGSYIDNRKGSEIQLAKLSTGTRASIYSLKSNYDYSGQAYYMAALVQISAATGKGDILAFDGNYTANAQRCRLFVNKQGSGYKLGLGWNGDPETWTEELAFGSTHLVVIKVTPKQAGNVTGDVEEASWWLDPDLSKTEGENDVFATVDGSGEIVTSGSTKGLKSVRGLTVRQRSNCAGKIAGLRFGANWADVVKAEVVPTGEEADYIKTNFNDGTWGEIKNSDLKEYSTSSINGFELVNAALWDKSATCAETSESFTNRIAINSLSNGGMVTLPTVKNVKQIIIYASSGSDDRYLTLQKFDYSAQKWEDKATYHIEDKGVCHRFVTELSSNELTSLRLANADGSTKYIWKIQTCPYPPTVDRERFVMNLADEGWSDLGTAETTATVNEVNFAKCAYSTTGAYALTGEKFEQRIVLGKSTGMIEMPAVASAARIDIYASAGSDNKNLKLQQYNYGLVEWEDLETTLHFDLGGVCYRFSVELNSTTATRLRFVNEENSTKNIYKIMTFASMPQDLAAPEALAAINVSAKSFEACWNAVEGATGYRVIRYKNGARDRVETAGAGVTMLPFRDNNITAATEYSYAVVAIGDNEATADSDPSNVIFVTTAPEINDVYTRPVTNGNYGTICLPKASADLSAAGAVFFKVAGKVMDGSKLTQIVFDEVTSLEAGKPYVFQATSDELNIPLTDDAVAEPDNSSSNGLIGAFTVAKVFSSVYVYVLSNNLLYCSKDQSYYVGENRAYFKVDVMSEYSGAAPAPGKRRVVMHAAEEQVATALDELTTTSSCCKIVRNGQISFIRNGVQFDVTGRQIK